MCDLVCLCRQISKTLGLYPRAVVECILAAAEARDSLDLDFVLTARCENFLWGRTHLKDTINRLQVYDEAGTDVLYAPGLPDLQSIEIVCASVNKPVNVIIGMPGALFSVEELERVGVKRISIGSSLARVAYGSLVSISKEVLTKGNFVSLETAMGFSELESHFK